MEDAGGHLAGRLTDAGGQLAPTHPVPSSPTPRLEPLQTEAPRLIKVAGATAISFALFDGAKRALHLANQQDVHDDVWQTALGYCGSAVSLTAVRVALLLDSDPKVISFQHIYSRLKRPDVVELLVHRACHASPLAEALDDRIADDVRASTSRFLETYTAIDWHDLHGRGPLLQSPAPGPSLGVPFWVPSV